MRYFYLIVVFCLIDFKVLGKSDSIFHHEVSIQFDNDLLLLQAADRYYTHGLFINYRNLSKEKIGLNKLFNFENHHKTIVAYSFVSQIFNPYNLRGEEEAEIDRPYAGVLYLSGSHISFWNQNELDLSVDLGWMGPATQLDKIQTQMHINFGWVRPRGWNDFQINNSLMAQLSGAYTRELVSSKYFSLMSAFDLHLGTVHNRSSLGFTVRFGKVNPISASSIRGSQIGEKDNDSGRIKEFFVFSKTNFARVFYNATIEGNVLGERSYFVKESEPWLVEQVVGIMLGTRKIDFQLSSSFLTREVKGGRSHMYGVVSISKRF